MIYHHDYRGLGFLVLVILLGAVVLGLMLTGPTSPLSPQAVARAQTVVAGGTPAPITPTGDTPTNGDGVSLEWAVIITLIVFIAGLVVGVTLSRPIIHP